MQVTRKCPLCNDLNRVELMNFPATWFDSDELSKEQIVSIVACESCGMVFNDTTLGKEFFLSYYSSRAENNPGQGMGSGLLSEWDIAHYERVYEIVKEYFDFSTTLVDVGCGRGGFLSYLQGKGIDNLLGIDLDDNNIDVVNTQLNISARSASSNNLEINDAGCLVYNFIFEHMYDIQDSIEEAWNSLAEGGVVFVEVPDVEAYTDHPFFPYYYTSLLEHINHFSAQTLSKLFYERGFEKLSIGRNVYNMSKDVYMPMVYCVFRKVSSSQKQSISKCDSKKGIIEYDSFSRTCFQGIDEELAQYVGTNINVFVWGACLELFALFTHTKIRSCNIVAIIDNNTEKQEKTISGYSIIGEDALLNSSPNDIVVLVSTIHNKILTKRLEELAFKGEILDFSQRAFESKVDGEV